MSVESLILDLKNQDMRIAWKAVEDLVKIGPPAVEPLIPVLKDEDKYVRIKVAEILGRIGDARAVEPLSSALQDENFEVRRKAAHYLGAMANATTVEPLINALANEDFSVRAISAEALGKFRDAKSVEPLIQVLKDENSYVRRRAAEALGRIGDARAIEPIKNALEDNDGTVRNAAEEALDKLKPSEDLPWLTYLANLKTIEKSDDRFLDKVYDYDKDVYGTPEELLAYNREDGNGNLQGTVKRILSFWHQARLSSTTTIEKKYDLLPDEIRIRRIAIYSDSSVTENVLYVVRLGEDHFFSWSCRVR